MEKGKYIYFRMTMFNFFNILLSVISLFFLGCKNDSESTKRIPNELRAPAYPLVTIDPYTSAWSFTDTLYEGSVKHWTGENFPLIGAIRVDGQIYRFMGEEIIVPVIIAPTAEQGEWNGRYILTSPASGWEKPEFNDALWKSAPGGFGSGGEMNRDMIENCKPLTSIPVKAPKQSVNTLWDKENSEIWVRREIDLNEDLNGKKVFFEYSHDDDFELYVNGIEVVNTGYSWQKNVIVQLPENAVQTLKKGKNILAAHCRNRRNGALVDFGLSIEAPLKRYMDQTAKQKSVDVQPTQTHYSFSCGPVDLDLTFTAPLLLDNLELISRPVNYISYSVKTNDAQSHDVEMYFEAAPNWAVNKAYQATQSEIIERGSLVYLKTGSEDQNILCRKGDNVRIDWGYFYLCCNKENSNCAIGDGYSMRHSFGQSGKIQSREIPRSSEHNHLGISQSLGKVSKSVLGKILIGYDDIYSIQYFGENLRPYWNTDGKKDIFTAFSQAYQDYGKLIKNCNDFDYKMMTDAVEIGGKQYADLCALAYRQSIAAHKLVKAPNGDLLFLSKENFSNGSIGTVDITYPSCPLFLFYNTELAKGLLNHIFYYSESGKWNKPFAAHDVGTYPIANGQTYGGDMPVEESGNVLILTAAIATMDGNVDYALKHWDVLTTWTDYLVEKGLDPENQLCTDDFAGHFAHNANLSIKAILGIASYGKLAGMSGKKEIAEKYTALAKNMAQKWMKMADDGDHYRLTFDHPGTWSQKYNLVWNKLLKMDIFPAEIAEKEVAFYLTKQNTYGLPLDNRETYTKADWIVWTATMANNKETFEKFIAPVYQFMNETVDRVPMTDWYWTDKPNQRGFQARSVVGGFFIKMLENKIMSK
jgi:hypothetical protein